MRHSSALRHLWIVGLAAACGAARFSPSLRAARQSTRQAAARVDYEKQVRPILEASCSECHSQDKRKGGLSLATYGDMLEGGRNGAVVRPGNSAGSLICPPSHRRDRAADAEGRAAARRRVDRAHPLLDRSGRARHADVGGGPGAVGGAAGARAPAVPADPLAGLERDDRSIRRRVPRRAQGAEPALVSDAVFARRVYLDVWGLLPIAGRAAGVPGRPLADKRDALVARLLADNQKYADHWISFWNDLLRNEDGVTYFSETAGRKSITDWLHRALAVEPPVRPVRHAADQPDRAGRSRRVPHRRQLARRDERRGHAVDAGGAEHRAGLSRRQPEVQRLPRQLRQQVEAQGRVRARRLLFARSPAAAVPLRRRAGCLCRAGIPLSRAEPRAAVVVAGRSPRRPLPRSSPIRATAGSRARSSIASGNASSATASSPTPTRWTASRGARRCSTRSPATSSSSGYDLKHLIQSILTSRAYQMPAVAGRPRSRRAATSSTGPEVRRLSAEQFADAIGSITGEWSVYQPRGANGGGGRRPTPRRRCRLR